MSRYSFVLLPLLISSVLAEDINVLLQDYVKASELSNKTKNENAGNLIIYTRDDLERMQALTLKDLLKSLRYFSYAESKQAQSDLLSLDAYSNNSKGIRLYLNNHELDSPLYGSGFTYFGDMELEFIDHVEIYTGFPSFEFGIEPARVVIRLYTKDATHDEGGKVKLMGGSLNSNVLSGYFSDSFDDFDYFAYAGHYANNREPYTHNGAELGRDQLRKRFYGSISNDNHRFELHGVKSDNDAFLGEVPNVKMVDNAFNYSYINVATHSTFLDDSLSLDISYTNIDSSYKQQHHPIVGGTPLPDVNTRTKNNEEESFTIGLQNVWNFENHDVTMGLEYRYKYFDISNFTINGAPTGYIQAYDTEDIFSLYLQDLYQITDNSVLSLSLMNQFYQRNGDVNAPNNLQLRLGYNYYLEKFTSKTTVSSQSFAAEPYTLISAGADNPNLKSESYYSFDQELTFKSLDTINNFIFTFARLIDYPIPGSFGEQIKPYNSPKDLDIVTASYEFTYFYSVKDKFEFNVNYSNSDSVYTTDKVELYSALLRSLNTFGNWDIFNELWMIAPEFDRDMSFDYTLGVKYRPTKDFSVQLKGENLLNMGEKRVFIDGTQNSGFVELETNVYDRKLWFGMEYLF